MFDIDIAVKHCINNKHTNPHTGFLVEEHIIKDTVLSIKIKYFCKYCGKWVVEVIKYYIEYMI